MLTEILEVINTKAAPVLSNLLGGSESALGGFVMIHPLLSIILCVVIPALILLALALFVDFVKDSWKMPFGIIADVLAFYAYLQPGIMTIIAMVVSVAVIMIFLHELTAMKWVFAVLSIGEIALTFFPGVPVGLAAFAGIFCLNTILFFIGCIID